MDDLADIELLKPTPLMTSQVRNVFAALREQGFSTLLSESGTFAALRDVPRGLNAVVRYQNPAALYIRFVGWPWRRSTLGEVRALLTAPRLGPGGVGGARPDRIRDLDGVAHWQHPGEGATVRTTERCPM